MKLGSILATVALLSVLHPLDAATIPVRYAEGVTRGFLVLSDVNGVIVAQGDLFQVVRRDEIDKRMVFHFTDDSVLDENVTFTQRGVFALKSYRLLESGPAFKEDRDMSITPATGSCRVKITNHDDGEEEILEEKLELPADVYNGLVMTVLKDLPKGAGEVIHVVAFTPKPRLIELALMPAGEETVKIGDFTTSAVHYVMKPRLGALLKFFATIAGRVPPDLHAWIAPGEAPAFVGFEGTLGTQGQVWRVDTNSPRRSR